MEEKRGREMPRKRTITSINGEALFLQKASRREKKKSNPKFEAQRPHHYSIISTEEEKGWRSGRGQCPFMDWYEGKRP